MNATFDHEKLDVYRRAVAFAGWADALLGTLPAVSAVCRQLDRAATSIALNIAEGNGKFSHRDRCRFLDIARGSALECAACLDILVAKGATSDNVVVEGRQHLKAIVSMLVGLIRKLAPERVGEDEGEYGCGREHEHEHEYE